MCVLLPLPFFPAHPDYESSIRGILGERFLSRKSVPEVQWFFGPGGLLITSVAKEQKLVVLPKLQWWLKSDFSISNARKVCAFGFGMK